MVKKMKVIVVVAIMVFGVFGLTGCDSISISDYKATKITQLQAYADAKGQDNYTVKGWELILKAVEDGKTAIDMAENRSAVDEAFNNAKDTIDTIEEKYLELTEELQSIIKADYLHEFGYELYFGKELLNKFYGLYKGAAVFFIASDDTVIKTVTISGVKFSYNYGWTILVWKDGTFYNLEDIEAIFDAGILTQADIEKIAAIHAKA